MKRRLYPKIDYLLFGLPLVLLSLLLPFSCAHAASKKKVPKGYSGIYTVKDLQRISNHPNQKYILMKNLHLTNKQQKSWKSIGSSATASSSRSFTGTFDGNGHTISHITLHSNGLFISNNGIIKNLTLQGTAKPNGKTFGGLATNNQGTIKNCRIQLEWKTASKKLGYYGSICAYNTGVIQSCQTEGKTVTNCCYGGIVYQNKKGHISKCVNTSSITASIVVGGIAAINEQGSITQCKNLGNITVKAAAPQDSTLKNGGNFSAGGITGNNWGYLSKCQNKGKITCPLAYACISLGGITGQNRIAYTSENADKFDSAFFDCTNSGSVTAMQAKKAYLGGIIGYHDSSAGTFQKQGFTVTHFNLSIHNCKNTGCINGYMPYSNTDATLLSGGILGNAQCGDANRMTLYHCENTGTICASGTTNAKKEYHTIIAGGIAGYIAITSLKNSAFSYLISCKNSASVTGFTSASGILYSTYSAGSTQVKSCTNSGKVTCITSSTAAYHIASTDTIYAVSNLPAKQSCKTKVLSLARFHSTRLQSGHPVVAWVSGNRKMASVNANGKVTALRPGTVRITAFLKEGRSINWKIKIK